jgi:ribosomal protein L40E
MNMAPLQGTITIIIGILAVAIPLSFLLIAVKQTPAHTIGCPKCDADVSQSAAKCPRCGAMLNDSDIIF